MASKLRKRLRRSGHTQPSLSPNASFSSPLDPIDLEANTTIFDPDAESQPLPYDGPSKAAPSTANRLLPDPQHRRPAPSATLPLLVVAISLFVMFLSSPQNTLCAVLTVLLFAPYPASFPRWTVLIPLVMPMTVKGRLEVILFLGLVIWLHAGCDAEWWFVVRRLEEAWRDWWATLSAVYGKKKKKKC